MPHLRIVGDVHGWVDRYALTIQNDKCKHSIQIGDMGFDYSYLNRLSYKKHKFFGGNHDNYDTYYQSPHSLGDYGRFTLGKLSFFFIRGAFSIDVKGRVKAEKRGHPKCWWREEQLIAQKRTEAIEDYKSHRPQTMITHTCPTEIAQIIGNPGILTMFGFDPEKFNTHTQQMFQACFDAHKPEVWIFGHFHKNIAFYHKDTLFICLREFKYDGWMDVDAKGKFIFNGFTGKVGQ